MIVAGFGFRSGACLGSLHAALLLAQQGHPVVTHLATIRCKLRGLAPLAEALGLPLTGVDPEILTAVPTITRSAASLAAYGTGSVAEASALAVAGADASLLGPRHFSHDRMATCAIAKGFST